MVPRSSITERRTQGEEIHSQFGDAIVVVWVAAAVDPGILTVSPPRFKAVAGISPPYHLPGKWRLSDAFVLLRPSPPPEFIIEKTKAKRKKKTVERKIKNRICGTISQVRRKKKKRLKGGLSHDRVDCRAEWELGLAFLLLDIRAEREKESREERRHQGGWRGKSGREG
ncbi:hypothetical protein BHM03_00060983 [Ensete ventricosum]|nr:hypothetical protein BHM03_00060983 [Ensete ventricosum]